MTKNLKEILLNYSNERISGDKVHIKARKSGKIVFNGYYEIYGTIEKNDSRLTIIWPEDGVVPVEYRECYPKSANRYPVDVEYLEEEDIVHLSGEYFGDSYKIVVQLPEKSRNV